MVKDYHFQKKQTNFCQKKSLLQKINPRYEISTRGSTLMMCSGLSYATLRFAKQRSRQFFFFG